MIVNTEYILHQNLALEKNVIWECKFRRSNGCPFRLETLEENGTMVILWMYKESVHHCFQDPNQIVVHKFKTEIKEIMKTDFKVKYNNVYNTEKKRFLEGIEDAEYRDLARAELPSIDCK